MPSLEMLLDDGIVVEVPDDIRELDWTIQARMDALASAIEELEEKNAVSHRGRAIQALLKRLEEEA